VTDTFARLQGALSDRYRLERELGQGGMATVYLAEDLKHHRKVALKVLKPELASILGAERFLAEINTTANLQHPHILPLHDSGEIDSLLYYVMPYVEGEALRERLTRERQLPISEVIHILRDMADALAYAHGHNVIHRDIKPDNVMLSGRHALVMDFGVSKALSQAAHSTQLTTAGISLGTPQYMAPEQALADPNLDHRADLYALGVTGYELLAGQPPFTGDSPQAVLAAHLTHEPTPLSEIRSAIPAELADLVMKCLEKNPTDRWQSADEIVQALELLATPSAGSVWRSMAWVPRSLVRRRRVSLAIVLAGLIAAVWLVTRSSLRGGEKVKTVAVLPLLALGADSSAQAFADGLADILTSKLTELAPFAGAPLWVVPSAEIRQKDINSVQRARRQFNVTLAITGSLQRTGDNARLILNLVDAEQVRQLRSAVILATWSTLSSLQDSAVRELLDMMAVEIQPRAGRLLSPTGTESPAAYELYVRGRGQLQRYDRRADAIDAAIRLFGEAIAHDSLFALAYAGLGAAYWGKFEQSRDTAWVKPAVEQSRRALMLDDSLAAVWATLALISNGTGQPEDALRHARRALALDPYNTEAYIEIGRAYESLHRPADAESALQRLTQVRPYYWRAHSVLAALYYTQGKYEDAVAQFAQAGDLSPGNAANFRNAGVIYFFLERWPEARATLERSLALERHPSALSNLGVIDYYEGHYDSAAVRFAEAVAMRNSHFVFWRNLGDAYRQLPGKQRESRSAYVRCAELAAASHRVNPSDATALDNGAFCNASLLRRTEAETALSQLVRVSGDDPELAYSIAQVLEELGYRDRALEWIGRAVRGGYSVKVIATDPRLARLRADSRFERLMAVRDTVRR
jgi:tetratricopeptide (TPR) repeat protein/tRNA A-37 threonylcarbamoyl transferase component Bud32